MDTISQHNELPTAYLSAIHQLGDCPARYIAIARKGRNIVYLSDPGAVIVQNEIVFKCTQKLGSAVASWSTPTTRENGTALAPIEIANYEMVVTVTYRNVIIIPAGMTEYRIEGMESGDYEVTLSTVLSDGLQSALLEPVSVTIN